MSKFGQCPKCGNPRFGYNSKYQSYVCQSCGFEDKKRLLPTEIAAFEQFKKFLALVGIDGSGKKVEVVSDSSGQDEFTYDKFKEHMSRYIVEEVRPKQEAKEAEEKTTETKIKKKRGRKPKNEG